MLYMRRLSVRHARGLARLYRIIESILKNISSPQSVRRLAAIKYIEQPAKRYLFDSQSCGQCILPYTGMSCPMNCPKAIRNGPCGGVRTDGKCEVKADMTCVWVNAWEGNLRMHGAENPPIQVLQSAIDHRLIGTSAWLNELKAREPNDL